MTNPTGAALDVECPRCHAEPGEWCKNLTTGNLVSKLHMPRMELRPEDER